MLEEALRANLYRAPIASVPSEMAASDYEPHICAAEVESLIFNAQKTVAGFKAAVLGKVREIKSFTDKGELCGDLTPPGASGVTSANSLSGRCEDGAENSFSSYKKPKLVGLLFDKASCLLSKPQDTGLEASVVRNSSSALLENGKINELSEDGLEAASNRPLSGTHAGETRVNGGIIRAEMPSGIEISDDLISDCDTSHLNRKSRNKKRNCIMLG